MTWIFKFIFWFFVAFKIFDVLTRNYVNDSKLVLYIGKKGSGKTTTLTKIALDHIKKGVKVYSTVAIPGTYHFNPEWLSLGMTIPEGSCLLIDEVGMIWDNRQFKTFSTNVRDFFKLQRHAHIKCYMFSQTPDVDKKLRDLCDELWLCKNVARVFSVQRLIVKKIGIQQDESGNGNLVDAYKFAGILGGLKFVFVPRYVQFFNSFELPEKKKPVPQLQEMTEEQRKNLSTLYWSRTKIREIFGKIAKRPEQVASVFRKRAGSLFEKFSRRSGKR